MDDTANTVLIIKILFRKTNQMEETIKEENQKDPQQNERDEKEDEMYEKNFKKKLKEDPNFNGKLCLNCGDYYTTYLCHDCNGYFCKECCKPIHESLRELGHKKHRKIEKVENSLPPPPPKKWDGKIPEHCEMCECKLNDVFIDGDTGRVGPGWALICKNCHDTYGKGLGVGKGQMYDLKTSLKIEQEVNFSDSSDEQESEINDSEEEEE